MNPDQELIFVYNSNSDVFSLFTDYLHKRISPDTYKCNLCKITYGVTMDSDWKEFIQSLPYKVTFLHKDHLIKKYPELASTPLPTVFLKENSHITVLATSEEVSRPNSVQQLIALMKQKLNV